MRVLLAETSVALVAGATPRKINNDGLPEKMQNYLRQQPFRPLQQYLRSLLGSNIKQLSDIGPCPKRSTAGFSTIETGMVFSLFLAEAFD
jgi:hypothetical protein